MKAIIETQGLVMRFGGVEVLRGIDFAIEYGELRCLIGPNGAGKSTFFKCITGQRLLRHSSRRARHRAVAASPSTMTWPRPWVRYSTWRSAQIRIGGSSWMETSIVLRGAAPVSTIGECEVP